MSGRYHSDDTKIIMSNARKGENHHNYGQTLSDDTKKKISDSHKGKTLSDDTRKKISDAQPTSQVIEVFNLEEKTQTIYDSIREAARALNINYTSIVKYFANNQTKPYKGIYTFTKVNK